ncbi:hydrophobe/amphiphile efflux-1 family RND transporter [Desulfobacter hydrogenophilus]|uniref:Efflux RND transporter permease subunit n=1 Tax=Desulfobacter hydrogenophilus TaxID=2291 RepID=A0A328F6G0_9BACT|nr:efflux RND transporter permease subunit [Desulfobacter hydrogenophilus]NDY74342.1 efflux RND transporter permease subunit [Desulfobacter hydrogenophilus]QBH12055.1 efflux RND transporter permease subunit [Desulfobacter hydrogenophilus]RAM00101.1 hydrophobe/amphiphile efflux-1 family RND transporter [Desulfobacter hydrogenophilus]
MIANFFIKRPIFAWVIALAIIGAGILSITSLPVEQYPSIAAPKVSISATYPGASAQTLENTVTQVIEQNLTGIDNLRYIQSESSSSGQASITLTFETGTDPDIAQVQTQNQVSQAQSALPQAVQRLGLSVRKAGSSYALIVAFYSKDDSYGRNDISDFLASNLEEPLSRVDGVGQIQTFGPEYAMRIWLNPQSMNNYNITTQDVVAAVQEQNVQLATGEIGGTPSVEGQQLNATITAQSLLETVEDFEAILLTVNQDGSQLTLGDVARIEIGAESYNIIGRYNRRPASGIAIELAPGANALATVQAVKDRVKEFEDIIPDALEIVYPIDISPFVKASIYEVVKTLVMAIVLVVLVIFVFLQTLRATFIPSVAIPVVILGTFAALFVLGYSINVLTLFALVLAIGMLVDDAIVVTENVENKLEKNPDLSPEKAAFKAMKEISGALVGTTVVIWAVFIPITFFKGATGVIYRQFAVTISVAMGISLFIALSLSPALCAIVLKQGKEEKKTGLFGLFNRGFSKMRGGHETVLKNLLASRIILPFVFFVLIAVTIALFFKIPTSFLPQEDQGRMMALVNGPVSSTLGQTIEKNKQVEDFYLDTVGGEVDGLFTAAGFSFSGRSQNVGIAFIKMKPWDERSQDLGVFKISEMAGRELSSVQDAMIIPIVPPPVSALGNASGFEFQLVDRSGEGQDALNSAMKQFLGQANQNELLTSVRFNGLAPGPQYDIDIDASKARAMGVSITTINQTLTTALGGTYVNDFLLDGRIKRVYVQADAPYRMQPEDINRWYVRNTTGGMVPLAEFGSGEWTYGAPKLTRFNGTSSLEIQGEAAEGISSGEALSEISRLARSLPGGVGVEWTGLSYEEKEAGGQAWLVYVISIIAVLLALAALYESWAIPVAIMLTVPLGIFGATLSTWAADQANDVYFQVGLLMTIALAAKNAILIIEFAKTNFEEGMSAHDAAITATKQRLRPILMTSLTFILGVMPLAFAAGPGSGAQNAIGIGVLGGITATTVFVLFFAPFFFIWVMRIFKV